MVRGLVYLYLSIYIYLYIYIHTYIAIDRYIELYIYKSIWCYTDGAIVAGKLLGHTRELHPGHDPGRDRGNNRNVPGHKLHTFSQLSKVTNFYFRWYIVKRFFLSLSLVFHSDSFCSNPHESLALRLRVAGFGFRGVHIGFHVNEMMAPAAEDAIRSPVISSRENEYHGILPVFRDSYQRTLSSYIKVYLVIYGSGSVPEQSIFSPREVCHCTYLSGETYFSFI